DGIGANRWTAQRAEIARHIPCCESRSSGTGSLALLCARRGTQGESRTASASQSFQVNEIACEHTKDCWNCQSTVPALSRHPRSDFVHECRDLQPLRYVAVRIRHRQGGLLEEGTGDRHFAVLTNIRDWKASRLLGWHREKAGTIE